MVYSYFTEQPKEEEKKSSNELSILDNFERVLKVLSEKEGIEILNLSDLIQEE
jgi:hypothetical protein